MTREEAIKIIENNRINYRGWKQKEFDEAIERLTQPISLSEFLGWEENQEYEFRDYYYKVSGDCLYYRASKSDGWTTSSELLRRYKLLRDEATKVKPKAKAWRVRDKYSYECLIKELNESFKYTNTLSLNSYEAYKENTVITENGSGLGFFSLDYLERYKDKYDIMDYYKEEPKYYVPSDWNKAVPVDEVEDE